VSPTRRLRRTSGSARSYPGSKASKTKPGQRHASRPTVSRPAIRSAARSRAVGGISSTVLPSSIARRRRTQTRGRRRSTGPPPTGLRNPDQLRPVGGSRCGQPRRLGDVSTLQSSRHFKTVATKGRRLCNYCRPNVLPHLQLSAGKIYSSDPTALVPRRRTAVTAGAAGASRT
jgi:hypothetical protein